MRFARNKIIIFLSKPVKSLANKKQFKVFVDKVVCFANIITYPKIEDNLIRGTKQGERKLSEKLEAKG